MRRVSDLHPWHMSAFRIGHAHSPSGTGRFREAPQTPANRRIDVSDFCQAEGGQF
jgi:hypothetical protein